MAIRRSIRKDKEEIGFSLGHMRKNEQHKNKKQLCSSTFEVFFKISSSFIAYNRLYFGNESKIAERLRNQDAVNTLRSQHGFETARFANRTAILDVTKESCSSIEAPPESPELLFSSKSDRGRACRLN